MVLGHNLHHMAPFDFSRAGFCMELRRASFYFSCPGVELGGPGSDFGSPRSTFWPGDAFGSILGSRKTYFCEEVTLWWGYREIPSAQMNSMVPGTHLGVLVCPKTSLFNYFVGISSFPGKLQVAPCGLPVVPCGSLGCLFPIPI